MATKGRPSIFTQELADRICEEISMGYSMRTVCKADDMPAPASVYKWLRENKAFSEQYARACEERSEAMIEDILDIADDGSNDWMEVNAENNQGWRINGEALQRSRLRVDTRKWYASKMKPKKYGDKLDVTSDGDKLGVTLSAEQAEQLIRARAKRSDS